MWHVVRVAVLSMSLGILAGPGLAQVPRVLFFSKSSGFEHPVIKRVEGQPSHVEQVLRSLAEANGFEIVTSKDGSLITASELMLFQAVIFYTTGDLTVAGSGKGLFGGDSEPGIPAGGIADLRQWVESGGALLGFHSASDTFRNPGGEPTPYIRLLGGEFLSHGRQFEGRVKVVDADHPTVRSLPLEWSIQDEWYAFRNLDTENLHVIALLDTTSDPFGQALYQQPAYPIIWCKAVGAGRVFYNAMGHREDVWDNATFQEAFLDALDWSLGNSGADATPNYDQVVPGQ